MRSLRFWGDYYFLVVKTNKTKFGSINEKQATIRQRFLPKVEIITFYLVKYSLYAFCKILPP